MNHFRSEGEDLEAFGFGDDTWLDRLRDSVEEESSATIGRYEILERVSAGAQGVVFRARDKDSGRIVALKRLLEGSFSNDRARLRFDREMEIVAGLDHPGIISLLGIEQDGTTPVQVFEWIEGVAPSKWLEQSGPALKQNKILDLFLRICDVVRYAHRHGVIHRDLKPSNILIDAAGKPHLLDFGIASLVADETSDRVQLTRTFEFLGTPAYSPPEYLLKGSRSTDIRGDIYSLGALLYEMLTGQLPCPTGSSMEEALDAVRNHTPRRPSSWDLKIRRDLDNILLKALAFEPDHRYQSVDAFADDVQRYKGALPVAAHPPSSWYLLRKSFHRHTAAYLAGSLVFVTTLGFGFHSWVQRQAAEAQRESRDDALHFIHEIMGELNPIQLGARKESKEILVTAAKSIQQRFSKQPGVRASLLTWVGESQIGAGDYRGAIENLTEAAAILQEKGEGQGMESVHLRSQLALAYFNATDFTAAELMLRRLEDEQRDFGPEMEQDLARTQTLLVAVLNIRMRFDEALAKLQEIRGRHLEVYGEDSSQVEEDNFQMALLMWNMGDFEGAERLQRELLAAGIEKFGVNSLPVSRARKELSDTLLGAGNLLAAETELREALRIRRLLLPAHHPDLGNVLRSLGKVLHQLGGEVEEAKDVLKECVDIYRRSNMVNHLTLAQALASLGTVHSITQEFEQADQYFEEAYEILRSRRGDAHPMIAEVLAEHAGHQLNASRVLQEPERSVVAVRLTEEANAIATRIYGRNHYMVGQYQNLFGATYRQLGDYPAAISAYLESVRIMSGYDEHDRHLAIIYNNLGNLYLLEENPMECRRVSLLALEICKANGVSSADRDYFDAALRFGLSALSLERFKEAIGSLEEVVTSPLESRWFRSHKIRARGSLGSARFRSGADVDGILQLREAIVEISTEFPESQNLIDLQKELEICEAM